MKIQSLRTRSLLTIVAVVVPVLIAFTLIGRANIVDQIDKRFDGRMRAEFRVLAAAIDKYGPNRERLHEVADLMLADTFPGPRRFGVWTDNQWLLTAPDLPFAAPQAESGYVDVAVQGSLWRTYSEKLMPRTASGVQWSRPITLMVAEPLAARDNIVWQGFVDFTLPILIAVPLTILGIYIALVRSLRPLSQLAGQIRERSAEQLQPIAIDDVPTEALPIAESVNSLMSRISESLEREKRFTADAAHELRTPLTALKANAQVALKTDDEQQRRESLRMIVRTVNRTDRLIAQLLTLARLEPQAQQMPFDHVDLMQVAKRIVSELRATAESRGQELQLQVDAPVVIQGSADALEILLRNLVENALRYSPDNLPVVVRVFRNESSGLVEVEDRGPGIVDEDKQAVFRRFRRVLGTNMTGVGLGLSIVQRIAELHGGLVSLSDGDAGIGLRVKVSIALSA
jgi:two-component system sensor histidine kinase QseC